MQQCCQNSTLTWLLLALWGFAPCLALRRSRTLIHTRPAGPSTLTVTWLCYGIVLAGLPTQQLRQLTPHATIIHALCLGHTALAGCGVRHVAPRACPPAHGAHHCLLLHQDLWGGCLRHCHLNGPVRGPVRHRQLQATRAHAERQMVSCSGDIRCFRCRSCIRHTVGHHRAEHKVCLKIQPTGYQPTCPSSLASSWGGMFSPSSAAAAAAARRPPGGSMAAGCW